MTESFIKDNPHALTLCAFRVYRKLAELIKECAEVNGQSPSDWLRAAVVEKIERQTGYVVPAMPSVTAGRPALRGLVEAAAASQGLSVEEYKKLVLERDATRTLGLTSHESGEHRITPRASTIRPPAKARHSG